jgi:glycosyltransferase involved in cell wall biosynthesis
MVRGALDVLPRFAADLEVIVVDDGSRDATGAIADALAAEDARVRVVHHPARRGYGGALRSGFAAARKEYVLFSDGDRQFDLADAARLVAAIDGADAVIGWRQRRADPASRRFIGWGYNVLIRALFSADWRDVDCAFKLFRRAALGPLARVRSDGAFFSAELLLALRASGAVIRQVGVPHLPRVAGEAKGASPRVIARTVRDLVALRIRGRSSSRRG